MAESCCVGLALPVSPLAAVTPDEIISGSSAWQYRAGQTDEGLPDNSVTGVAQTADGFLWVATFGGLMRFNGTEFEEFSMMHLPDVPNRVVLLMFLVPAGRFWLAMDRDSVVCADRTTAQGFTREDGLAGSRVLAFAADGAGGIWVVYADDIVNVADERVTRLADELGVKVWSEMPVYWTIDWTNPETYANAQSQLSYNIDRNANCASIIIWSLANESPVSEPRTRFLTKLAEQACSLDRTRLLSAAIEKHSKPGAQNVNLVEDPLADVVDVVAFNQYVGWYDGLPEKCGKVSWEISYNKPVFVSEFGGDARQGYHGNKEQRWTEEFQEDRYQQTLAMLDKIDGFAGLSPWILVDFRSPRRPLVGI